MSNENKREAWFDRKFDFDHLTTTFSNLVERLGDAPLRLREKVKSARPTDRSERLNDRWSIQEHAGHLHDLEVLWIGRVADMIEGKEMMRAADLTNQKTEGAAHNESNLEEILKNFEKSRSELVQRCLQHAHIAESAFCLHPRLLKPMRLIDLMYFVAEHDDHHFATISLLNRQFDQQQSHLNENNEYVLGTHEAELHRLGFQHEVWASEAYESWKIAGFTQGQTILDLGCGPGFATRDLAYMVGSTGTVIAVDKSQHYITFLEEIKSHHGLPIETQQTDFLNMSLQPDSLDGVYCRWALAWLDNPEEIINKIAAAMRKGGTFIVQEYFNWKSFQTEPYSHSVKVALESVLASFDQAPGNINVGSQMAQLFQSAELEVVSSRPLSKICHPGDLTWYWPKTFLHIYLPRVVEFGLLSESTMHEALEDWERLENTKGALCFTPQMIEVIGRK